MKIKTGYIWYMIILVPYVEIFKDTIEWYYIDKVTCFI